MAKKWFSFLDRSQRDEDSGEPVEGTADGGSMPELAEEPEMGGDDVELVSIHLVDTNPYQPRKTFAEEDLQELATSIAQYGVLQPVVLRRKGDRFELIVGERRLRASKMAGLDTIPALIRKAADPEIAVLALVENLQRQDLGFFEEAAAYERLLEDFELTQAALAEQIGKSQSTIANKLRLLRLPTKVKDVVVTQGLSERHARALLGVDTEEQQLEIATQVVEGQLSVRETDDLVKRMLSSQSSESRGQRVVRVYKDLRIFLNSFRELVRNLREIGIEAKFEQEETDGEMVVRVRIPRGSLDEASRSKKG